MTLLITVCLLIVCWYLARFGLFEKQWYEQLYNEQERESDEGLFGELRDKIAPNIQDPAAESNSRLAKTTARIQERTDKMSEKFEARASKFLEKDESETLFGKLADKVRGGDEQNNMFNKMKDRVSAKESDNILERMTAKVGSMGDFADKKVQALRDADESEDDIRAKEKDSFFGRMVDKVNNANEKMTAGVENKMKQAGGDDSEDFLTRMSNKIGTKVNDLDDRAIESGRKLVK